jgi:3-phosphoshikimate 1-carboxyvinyltransferase
MGIKVISSPVSLSGEISLPGDKSISHRAVILNSLASGEVVLANFSPGADCLSTVNCLRGLGVKITQQSSTLEIKGVGKDGLSEPDEVLDAGNSATTMRLLTGLLAAQPFFSILTGDSSLRSRPMDRVIQPLRLMGANIWGRGGDKFAPLAIWGTKLRGITYSLPVASAQIKSAILLAGLFAQSETTVIEPDLSRDHTERLLQAMGAKLTQDSHTITVSPLTSPLKPINLDIPGDISSAAYWLVAGAIHPQAKIKLCGVGINPSRAGIIDVLLAMGAKLRIENQHWEGNEPVADLWIESSELRGIEIGGELIPRLIDEIPVIAVAASVARGTTVIRGAGELRVKETDRIRTVTVELTKLGAKILESPDGMEIYGGKLTGAECSSYSDHRLAMALAVAGLVAEGKATIQGAEAVKYSYPSFWHDLEKLSTPK